MTRQAGDEGFEGERQGGALAMTLANRPDPVAHDAQGPPAPRADDPAAGSRAVLAHHGKSFNWAGRFLSRGALDRAARLYAFCRYLDDLADEHDDVAQAERNLRAVREDLARGRSTRPDVADFFDLCDGAPSAIAGAILLADTLIGDLTPMRIDSVRALQVYSLGVAGCVGIMMCPVLDVAEPERAMPFAIDLGIAMQMTNIARDVLEDAGKSRIYLPPDWTGGPLDPDDLVRDKGDARARAWGGVVRLLQMADAHYASARAGLCFLPFQARAAIHVASRVYRGIGTVVLAGGPERYWLGRAYTSSARKVMLTAGALGGLGFLPGRGGAVHDPRLHGDIAPTLRAYGFDPQADGIVFSGPR
ncbi:MAG: squalene/phytoene synthase family protein [Alphaproteobacteria bacterium]